MAPVRRATVGIRGRSTKAAVAISCMRRWPAVRFAVSRTPSAKGRMNRLIVSMMIRTGMRGTGVPSGRRCPRAMVGWFRIPMRTVANHKGTASPMFIDSWVVGVKVYGSSPSMFREIRNSISDANSRAHLWPPILMGANICDVNRLINQPCKVKRRLFSHREVGAGKSSHGSRSARAIRGTPR